MTVEPQDDASAIAAAFGRQLENPAMPFTLLVRFQVRDGIVTQSAPIARRWLRGMQFTEALKRLHANDYQVRRLDRHDS